MVAEDKLLYMEETGSKDWIGLDDVTNFFIVRGVISYHSYTLAIYDFRRISQQTH